MLAEELAGVVAREYLRVSLDQSGRERSNVEQSEDNRRAWRGVTWGEPYRDTASASRYSRKARDDFARLMDDLRAGRFGAGLLVLWEASRGSRKVGEWDDLIEVCEAQKVRIAVTEHRRVYDPTNPRDRRSLLEDAVDSAYESDKTSRRALRARAATAAHGGMHGRRPFGYQRLYDPTTGRLSEQVPHPIEAEVVREIFARIRKGHSLNAITDDLAARGVVDVNGNPLTRGRVRYIARNRLYAGERIHAPGMNPQQRDRLPAVIPPAMPGVSVTKGLWEPLVDRATWLTVRRILDDPARVRTTTSRHKHLLTRIVLCGPCGTPISARTRDGVRTYQCYASYCTHINADPVDEYVTAAMLAWLQDPDQYGRLAAEAAGDTLAEAEADLAAVRAELDDLADRAGRGEVSVAFAARIEHGLQQRLGQAQRLVDELSTPSQLQDLIEPGPGVEQRWKASPLTTQRAVARILLSPALLGQVSILRRPATGRWHPVESRVGWKRVG